MPQFHETIMGKRFIEGTMPALVRALEKLVPAPKLPLTDEQLMETLIELLTAHRPDGYCKTIKGKLHYCITGPQLLALVKDIRKL